MSAPDPIKLTAFCRRKTLPEEDLVERIMPEGEGFHPAMGNTKRTSDSSGDAAGNLETYSPIYPLKPSLVRGRLEEKAIEAALTSGLLNSFRKRGGC